MTRLHRRVLTGISCGALGLFGAGACAPPAVVSANSSVPSAPVGRNTASSVKAATHQIWNGGPPDTSSDWVEPRSTPWDHKGWSGRVVIGEYVTGVGCGPCQAHELAFDALIRRYPATAFIPLAYHGGGNLPAGDPADSLWERMYVWYGTNSDALGRSIKIFEVHQFDNLIDGHGASNGGYDPLGGPGAKEQFDTMAVMVDQELQKAPEAVLHVQATPQNGKIIARVAVDSLAAGHSDVYVRVMLVEDTIRFIGDPTSQRRYRLEHYMVVRGVAHTPELPLGLPLHGTGTVEYTFDVARAYRRLLSYYKAGTSPASQKAGSAADSEAVDQDLAERVRSGVLPLFPKQHDWQIDPLRLHVVAFVQDAKTGDVLQAQMIPVDGKQLTL